MSNMLGKYMGYGAYQDAPVPDAIDRAGRNMGKSMTERVTGFRDNVLGNLSGSITEDVPFVAANAVGTVAGVTSDLLGFAPEAAADLATPDSWGIQEKVGKAIQAAAEGVLSTEQGQDLLETWQTFEKENPRQATTMKGTVLPLIEFALDRAGLRSTARGVNSAALNSNTEVRNFYSGNPILKLAGAAESFGIGAYRAAKTALSPKLQKLAKETGISEGLLQQVDRYKGILEDLPNALAKVGGDFNKLPEELQKKFKQASSYTQGAFMHAYLMNKQLGTETQFLDAAVGSKNILATGDMTPESVKQGVFQAFRPELNDNLDTDGLSQNLTNHLMAIHGKGEPNANIQVITRNPTLESEKRILVEAFNTNAASDTGRALASIRFTPEDLSSVDNLIDKLQYRFIKSADMDSVKKVTSAEKFLENAQQKLSQAKEGSKAYERALENVNKRKLELAEKQAAVPNKVQQQWNRGKRGIRYDEATDTYYFSDSKKSSLKDLGGMNHWFALRRDGELAIVPNDGYDMLGQEPIGGDVMVNVYPAVRTNILKPDLADTWTKRYKTFEAGTPVKAGKDTVTAEGEFTKLRQNSKTGEYSAQKRSEVIRRTDAAGNPLNKAGFDPSMLQETDAMRARRVAGEGMLTQAPQGYMPTGSAQINVAPETRQAAYSAQQAYKNTKPSAKEYASSALRNVGLFGNMGRLAYGNEEPR